MGAIKKKIIISLVIIFVALLYSISSTITKYTTGHDGTGTFNIGKKLYFNYERGDLFRNNNLIVGNPVEEDVFDSNGQKIDVIKRIETMNVTPGDNLTYHFYVSNYDLTTSEKNGISGAFYVTSYAEFLMPALQKMENLECTLAYRVIPNEAAVDAGPFRTFSRDSKLNLPVYDDTDRNSMVKYEFQVYVILDDQISTTSADDYIDATLTISLFIDAASNQEA